VYYVDSEEISRLSIPADILQTPIEVISIIGNGRSLDAALRRRQLVEMSLEGAVASELSAGIGVAFAGDYEFVLEYSLYAIAAAAALLFFTTFALYRNPKISAMAVWTFGLELFYIVGVIALSQSATRGGWVVDSLTMVGIAVFSVASSVQAIMATEKLLHARFAKAYKYLSLLLIAAGLVLSFSVVNRFGLALAIGGAVAFFLTKPYYEEFAVKFKR
jgi:hypothetical protein